MGSDEGCPKRNSAWRAISRVCVGIFDENARFEADPDHSEEEEERSIVLGYSIRARLLLVVHVIRGERFRVICARTATPLEGRRYDEAARSRL